MPQPILSATRLAARERAEKRLARLHPRHWFQLMNGSAVALAMVVVLWSGPIDFWSGLLCGLILVVGTVVFFLQRSLDHRMASGGGSGDGAGGASMRRRMHNLEIEVALLREELEEAARRLEDLRDEGRPPEIPGREGPAQDDPPERALPHLLSKAFACSGDSQAGPGLARFIRRGAGGEEAESVLHK